MFNEQPSYLGGMSTVMQDSMNGVQYGREPVNDGSIVPNQGAQGTVYREKPKMKKQDKTVSPAIKKLVRKYTEGQNPIEFYGLKLPASFVKQKPEVKDWIKNLEQYEQALSINVKPDTLLNSDLNFSVALLEVIRPGTWNSDTPIQITQAQTLRKHLMKQVGIPTFVEHQNATRRGEELAAQSPNLPSSPSFYAPNTPASAAQALPHVNQQQPNIPQQQNTVYNTVNNAVQNAQQNNVAFNNVEQIHNQQAANPLENVYNHFPEQETFINTSNFPPEYNNATKPWYKTKIGMAAIGIGLYSLYTMYLKEQ